MATILRRCLLCAVLSLSADAMLLNSPVALPCRARIAGIILMIVAQPVLTWEVEFDRRRPKLFGRRPKARRPPPLAIPAYALEQRVLRPFLGYRRSAKNSGEGQQ